MKITAVLIGLGRIMHILENDRLRGHPCAHLGGLLKFKQFKIKEICDINPERTAFFLSSYPELNPRAFDDYKKMLNQKIDLAVIATYTESHYEIAKYAIEKGVKTLVIEKPMCLNMNQAGKLRKLAEKYNVSIFVNFERRYQTDYNFVKKIINKKELGSLKIINGFVSVNYENFKDWHIDLKKVGGGVALHDAIHMIDIAEYLAGKPKKIRVSDKKYYKNGLEKYILARIKYSSGAWGNFYFSAEEKYFNFDMDIIFESGRIQIGNGLFRMYKKDKSRLYENFIDLNLYPFKFEKKKNAFIELYREVLNSFKKKKIAPTSGIENGYSSLKTIFSIYKK